MVKEANGYGKKTIRKGFSKFGIASAFLYPVGASVGALESLASGPVKKELMNKIMK
ncbi:hypothetical protein [Maridesulfovibrio sp.]|uniref:hypothetical protein n=1 Tax=Maridesulfovibrio sp. TaxID=2795000 RepID=UPI002A187A20|nr:hypothetical protein [Maridesulfovibrio sp.]